MICPNCGYDKWDGASTHMFGGRATSGVNCWGPKTFRAAAGKAAVVSPKVPTVERSAHTEQQQIEHRETTPKKEKKPTRAERIAAKFAALGLKLGSAVGPPDPASRPSKPSRRSAGQRSTRARSTEPSAGRTGRTAPLPVETSTAATSSAGDRIQDSDTPRTRAPGAVHRQQGTSDDPFGGDEKNYRRGSRRSQRT